MIRIFHKYKQSVMVGLVICAVCFVMTGFGLGFLQQGGRDNYAIKVDDAEITHRQFYEQKRSIEDNYRRMLGKAFDQFGPTLLGRLNEQLIDKTIGDTLLERFASAHNMYAGDKQVQELLMREVFRNNFDAQMYQAFLRQMGMSAQEFEAKLASDALREEFNGVLETVSRASRTEARALFERSETTYLVGSAEFAPSTFVAEIKEADEAKLKQMYEDKAAELELPARASYDYLVLEPAAFESQVEVLPEDVELYYTDNEKNFMTPEELHLRHIQFTYAAKATPEEMAKLRTKADEVRNKLSSGETFENLATQFSDDFTTASNGGDLGWVTKGMKSKQFDEAVSKLKPGEISGVVQTDYGFHIIKLEQRKEPQVRPLEEVRAEIESVIRKREAPAYANAKGHELFEAWDKQGGALKEFAASNKLVVQSVAALSDAEHDPAPELQGLTKEVLNFPDLKRQVVDLQDKVVLVDLLQFKEAAPPPFEEARAKLQTMYKEQEASVQARAAAEQTIKDLNEKKATALEAATKQHKGVYSSRKDAKAAGGSGIFSDSAVKKFIAAAKAGALTAQPLLVEGKYYVLQVDAVTPPEAAKFEEKENEFMSRASSQMAQDLSAALVNQLKAKAKIDVDPSIMGG